MANSVESLDLYAKIESMLENEAAVSELYGAYLKILDGIAFDTLLDVGCGSGGFLELTGRLFAPAQRKGIDLSPVMAARTRSRGIAAEAIDLCEETGQYEVITAVFDMVNYLDADALKRFGSCIHARLVQGGYFLCDINTEYGFAEIASGSFTAEDERQFLVIDSDYEKGVYRSDFTLFEREESLYRRSDEQIIQYLHTPQAIIQATGLSLVSEKALALYGEESDKILLVLRKV